MRVSHCEGCLLWLVTGSGTLTARPEGGGDDSALLIANYCTLELCLLQRVRVRVWLLV